MAIIKYIEPEEIKKALSILKPNNELFEVRIIGGKDVCSGYFNDADILIKELNRVMGEGVNVYVTLHKLHSGCAARLQYNQLINTSKVKTPTTSDRDIIAYKYIPIDLDPVRPAGISSTIEELDEANELCKQIEAYMQAQGFCKHIRAFSGNGYHLLYPYESNDTAAGLEEVKGYLNRLDELFSNDACHVDTANCNPSRVFKLYGTLAQKGRNTEERPHRMSRILEVIDNEED